MRTHRQVGLFIGLIMTLSGFAGQRASRAADISGSWGFSVDMEDGGRGEPTFVFRQESEKLTGTYAGPLGNQKVSGTVNGERAVFTFEFTRDGRAGKATYTGTVESATTMTGTVEFRPGPNGKWTATKK